MSRKYKKKYFTRKIFVILLSAFLLFFLQACSNSNTLGLNQSESRTRQTENASNKAEEKTNSFSENNNSLSLPTISLENIQENLNSSFSIGMIGDVLFHDWLIKGGEQADGSYDYSYIYEYLEEDLKKLDLAMFNMEGTLAGPPYTGYPVFSAPSELADAMAEKGFDLATTASNHTMDRGVEGVEATIDSIRNAGMDNLGSRKEGDPIYFSKEFNGIRVAIATSTYESGKLGDQSALNGIPIPKEIDHLIDSFSLEQPYMSQDIVGLQEKARTMRADGNEVVIFIMHWGDEYQLTENWYQEILAQALADAGVDLVIGMHPHVIEPIRSVTSTDGAHEMLVYYSLGNSVSDQDYYTADMMGHCQDGLMAIVQFQRNSNGEVSIGQCGYIATYCHMIKISSDASQSQVIPVQRALKDPAAYGLENNSYLIQDSYDRTQAIMDGNTINNFNFKSFDSLLDF